MDGVLCMQYAGLERFMLEYAVPYKRAAFARRFLLPTDYTMAYETQANHTTQVTVLIAGRPYLLHINSADEALLHRLAKEINDKVAAFQAGQPSRDLQDCFALALLTYALELQRTAQRPQAVAAY